jgi:predicted RNA-binding protein YlqC (UPF0109 family)
MFTDLIEYIAESLVDHPDEVKIKELEGERVTILELSVAEEDLGKVIGKYGRTLRAMQTLLSAAGLKANKKNLLELIEQ